MSGLRLYHYTCSHGVDGITGDGYVKPNLHPVLTVDPNLVILGWFTDLDVCDYDALGLTAEILQCDRSEYRFEVDPSTPVWWPVWRRRWLLGHRDRVAARGAVEWLEGADGALPARWWVSEVPVPVVRVKVTVR